MKDGNELERNRFVGFGPGRQIGFRWRPVTLQKCKKCHHSPTLWLLITLS